MMRRLFFLLPERTYAEALARDLDSGIVKHEDIHAVVRGDTQLNGVDDVHNVDERDKDYYVEWWAWRLNLGVFFIALLVFVAMLVWQLSYWIFVPAAVMVTTLVAGFLFAIRIPNVHLAENVSAVRHGEVLMMVDVPHSRVSSVSHHVKHSHPEAVAGGVGWHV